MKKKIRILACLAAFVLAMDADAGGVRAMLTEEEQLYNKKKKEEQNAVIREEESFDYLENPGFTGVDNSGTYPEDAQAMPDALTENAVGTQSGTGAQTNAGTQSGAGTQTGAAAKQQAGADAANEAEAGAETESESETEPRSETETESEMESESESEPETGARETEKANGILVMLDPGHQAPDSVMSGTEPNGPGSDVEKDKMTPGAVGVTSGVEEYELVLAISQKLREELTARGYQVMMTRETADVSLSNIDRCQMANDAKADILIHIHANTVDDSSATGAVSTVPSQENPYISDLYDECMTLSDDVLREYCKATGFQNNGSWRSDNLASLNWSKMPVMVLELGYMTNAADDAYMTDPKNQDTMAQGIANGIDVYFGRE